MSALTLSQLFTPATSGVGTSVPAAPASGSWYSQLLANATTLGLPTTSWQPGGVGRTLLATFANALGQEDGVISIMAQGGFLDFAASGTVTYSAANGATVTAYVTPDPSIAVQNSTGAPGWLDVLADSVYNVQRIGATAAPGTMAVVNTSGNTYGAPYAIGTYHVASPTTGATYANVASLSIAPSTVCGTTVTGVTVSLGVATVTTSTAHGLATGNVVYITGVNGVTGINTFWTIIVTGASTFTTSAGANTPAGAWTSGGVVYLAQVPSFVADIAGVGGTAAPYNITSTLTSNSGVFVTNMGSFVGSTYESNTALAARCRAKLAALSPNGARAAYSYFALSASAILSAATPPVTLTAPINRAVVLTNAITGVVTTIMANAAGTVAGVANMPITGATNATPIVITATGSNLQTGTVVTITGVLGNTAANGTWVIARIDANTFSLTGSVGNGGYSFGGGNLEAGDLGQVDLVLQTYCVPGSVTAVTQSATAFSVSIVATVTVPQALTSTYQAVASAALTSYFSTIPIGGIVTTGTTLSQLQYNEIIGVLYAAGQLGGSASYVQQVNALTLNGTSANVTYPSAQSVAQISSMTINVVGA